MIRTTALVAALATCLAVPAARAGIENAGTTAANFLSIGAGAGVLGMGGAALGMDGDLQRTAWNVAGLASVDATQFSFSHASLAAQNNQEWFAAGGRIGRGGTRWGLSALYQGDGSFEGRDALGNPTGSFSASSAAFGASLARRVSPVLSVGAGVKLVRESLGDVSGAGLAFDLGVLARSGPFGFGAAAQNAFGRMSYDGASYPFPANYGVGASFDVPGQGVTLALDLNFPAAYYSDARFGLEWRALGVLALRTGYRMELGAEDGEPLTGPTFGMGAGINGFRFDYGYVVGGGGAGGQHRLGLSFLPGVPGGFGLGAPAAARAAVDDADQAARVAAPAREKSAPARPAARSSDAEERTASGGAKAGAPAAEAKAGTNSPERVKLPRLDEAKKAPAVSAEVKPTAPAPTRAPALAAPVPVTQPVALPAAPAPPAPRAEAAQPASVAPRSELAKTSPAPSASAALRSESAKTSAATPQSPAVAVAPAPAQAAPESPAAVAPVTPQAPTAKAPPAKPAPRPTEVVLARGETLEDVAARWECSVAAIMMENNLITQKKVKAGLKLKLPPRGR
uniref:PorV/PorQ family protein n=1 Tax=Eiseniibacteriota bacterium TaxID=2212470 RepID=A0A832MLA6_UNCEI